MYLFPCFGEMSFIIATKISNYKTHTLIQPPLNTQPLYLSSSALSVSLWFLKKKQVLPELLTTNL